MSRLAAVAHAEGVTGKVEDVVSAYSSHFDQAVDVRKQSYTTLVNQFYDLMTTFYEYGWGASFHFGARFTGESFEASIARQEMYLALRLQLGKGQRVLDVGCGVGGPARCIARFSRAHVTGLNNNAYQLERARVLTAAANLNSLCSWLKADFMHIPEKDNTYDAVYQIEATCHAPDKVGVYSEILRVLKPGACFAGYEWVMTSKYDPNNPTHLRLKKAIEVGNGIADLETAETMIEALKKAGFEVLETEDLALPSNSEVPWYLPLSASYSVSGFPHTKAGRLVTHTLVWLMEKLRLAPTGTTQTHGILLDAADNLVEAGKLGIFTPMHFVLCRKPLKH